MWDHEYNSFPTCRKEVCVMHIVKGGTQQAFCFRCILTALYSSFGLGEGVTLVEHGLLKYSMRKLLLPQFAETRIIPVGRWGWKTDDTDSHKAQTSVLDHFGLAHLRKLTSKHLSLGRMIEHQHLSSKAD